MKSLLALAFGFLPLLPAATAADAKPHIIFVMADDMGWGQTGYRGHPVLKTPNLDAMAAAGLRFERFYAGGPVCSPTRASMLTGRTHERAGVLTHGYALRPQEKTIAQALKEAGYVTGHFGKWHLDGFKGPGAPILPGDPRSPGAFGFDEWVSVTNFFDVDPLMSRAGKIEEFRGDSSDVAMAEAVKFLGKHRDSGRPVFAVVWFGSPHSPFKALDADKAALAGLDEKSANHYGELVAVDRAIGTLRKALRDFGIAQSTMVVFCSDNGGLPEVKPGSTGGLRGHKGSVFEGGIRVPGIIEWPGVVQPRVTNHPACVMDLFPTIADLLSLPDDVMVKPQDGKSLLPLFTQDIAERGRPIGFRYSSKRALVDDRWKLLTENLGSGKFQLYDVVADPAESRDLGAEQPEVAARMRKQLLDWDATVSASFAGGDYPGGRLNPADLPSLAWYETDAYAPFLPEWQKRWEYKGVGTSAQRAAKPGGSKKKK